MSHVFYLCCTLTMMHPRLGCYSACKHAVLRSTSVYMLHARAGAHSA